MYYNVIDSMQSYNKNENREVIYKKFKPKGVRKGVCTEAGMNALRERRVHVIQQDLEMAITKILGHDPEKNIFITKMWK